MVVWLIGWLFDWLDGSLIDWMVVWLLRWFFDWMVDWLTYWMVVWLTDWLFHWLIGWFVEHQKRIYRQTTNWYQQTRLTSCDETIRRCVMEIEKVTNWLGQYAWFRNLRWINTTSIKTCCRKPSYPLCYHHRHRPPPPLPPFFLPSPHYHYVETHTHTNTPALWHSIFIISVINNAPEIITSFTKGGRKVTDI